jgi:signal peptidase I
MAKDSKAKKTIYVGPIRHNLEAFGVAILAAVLLKWFCIEAYQIPTSSMQPTLMGSSEANVHDRILVNKLIQTIREPKRWDITVFKYPLQKNQNYVKRIVGMPNDRLNIGGGNVYQVEGDGKDAKYTVLRKPDDLQEDMWKNVYPLRREARSEVKALGSVFGASPSRAAKEIEGGFVIDPGGKNARLFFRDQIDGGMIDRVWDGYPVAVARAMRDAPNEVNRNRPQEITPDVRIAANVTPTKIPKEFSMAIEVVRPKFDKLTYALTVKGQKGALQVLGPNNKLRGSSEEFDVPMSAGQTSALAFAHVDEQLIAWQDGSELMRWDSSEWSCREGCSIPWSGGFEAPTNRKVIPQFACKGSGKITLTDVRIDRDQHYTRDIAPEIINVTEGHYYMMGDNTLQSIDSRGWTAITIGVDKDDNIVPLDSESCVRQIRGNKRAMRLSNAPDRDETPIAIPDLNTVVMIDEFGEILRLKGQVGSKWPDSVSFINPDAKPDDPNREWEAIDTSNTEGISLVPRSDIQGRALMVFYPARPISWLTGSAWPDRFGLVR